MSQVRDSADVVVSGQVVAVPHSAGRENAFHHPRRGRLIAWWCIAAVRYRQDGLCRVEDDGQTDDDTLVPGSGACHHTNSQAHSQPGRPRGSDLCKACPSPFPSIPPAAVGRHSRGRLARLQPQRARGVIRSTTELGPRLTETNDTTGRLPFPRFRDSTLRAAGRGSGRE